MHLTPIFFLKNAGVKHLIFYPTMHIGLTSYNNKIKCSLFKELTVGGKTFPGVN